MSQTTTAREEARRQELLERGAEFCKRETRGGQTKAGWFLDGVFVGATTREALEAING